MCVIFLSNDNYRGSTVFYQHGHFRILKIWHLQYIIDDLREFTDQILDFVDKSFVSYSKQPDIRAGEMALYRGIILRKVLLLLLSIKRKITSSINCVEIVRF